MKFKEFLVAASALSFCFWGANKIDEAEKRSALREKQEEKADAPNVEMRAELQKTVDMTIAELKAAQDDKDGLTSQETLEIKQKQMKECGCDVSITSKDRGITHGGWQTTVGASKFNPETNKIVRAYR